MKIPTTMFILGGFILSSIPVFAHAQTYGYIDTNGTLQTVVADTAQEAIMRAPNRAIHSGVMTMTTTPAVTGTVFTNPTSKEHVVVAFNQNNDTAVLTGLGYSTVVLTRAVSGSGARYVNDAQKLEVWNVGETVTISHNGTEIFSGNIGGKTDVDKLTGSTWVWQATTEGNTVTEPKEEHAFTLSFNSASGTMYATTDCNSIFGPYTVGSTSDLLSFGALGMTKKYCAGSQEDLFADGLSKVTSFMFDASGQLALEFASSSGSMLFSK